MFCLLLRSEIQNTCQFLCGFAVCSWGFECERAKYIPFSFFASYFPYNLVPRATIWQVSTTHEEVALAKRNATLVTNKMGIKRLFCMFWFMLPFLDRTSSTWVSLKYHGNLKNSIFSLHPLKSGRNVISSVPYFSVCKIVMALLPVRLLFSSGRLVVYLSFYFQFVR